MVAKVISGKNIRGVINYNENKVEEGVAQCIMASGFGCKPEELTFSDKLNRFRKVIRLNPKVKTNAIHISLNFDTTEKLSAERFQLIASDYMNRIGFGEQPYLVYQHNDAAHPHVHIVTTNVKKNGGRIDIHNIGKGASEKARKEIEIEYGLVRAEDRRRHDLIPVLAKAVYGKTETKLGITNVVRAVTRSYKYTSLPELNAVLRQFNVIVDRGAEGSPMFKKGGLVYSILDEMGNKVGVPIKASSIYGKPTLKNLEKQFKLNEMLRKPLRENLQARIGMVLKTATSPSDFARTLEKVGVSVLFRENAEGRIYGVTFIDNWKKAVFNGSDLGKAYSAKPIMEQLRHNLEQSPKDQLSEQPTARTDLQLDQLIKDLITAESIGFAADSVMRRRKKRKKKG